MQLVPFSAEIAPQLERLFTGDRPIPIRLWAILDGVTQGRILVDVPTNPTFAIVQELAEGTTYMGGVITPQALSEAFAILRTTQEVVICLWPDDPLRSALLAGAYYEGTAIDFTDRSPTVDLNRLAAAPSGYYMQRINYQVVPSLEGFDYYIAIFGSVERAIQNTVGYCLMQGETVVSEAVAGPFTRGIAEIGVATRAAYRKKGFATLVSACVIRECESMGYQAFWNASQQNDASVRLAKRLGFQTERPCTVLAWSATQ